MADDLQARLIREFAFFAEMCEGVAPLYASLSARVAQDAWLRGLSVPKTGTGTISAGNCTCPHLSAELGNVVAAKTHERQPPSNMLFGAVQFLLLGGADHPLRDSYPSIAGAANAAAEDDAWPHFIDFCRQHEASIRQLVATRRVQTNVVGRCSALLPGFELSARACGRAPLFLIELGPSAGLNLNFDRYRYEYSNGATCGDADASIIIRAELLGDHAPPVPDSMPRIRGRVGVDKSPVDVRDAEQTRWVEALIWADDVDRHAQFRAAVELARQDPPRLIEGDGLELVPRLIADVPEDAIPVVYHSHAIYQMPDAWRDAFSSMLDDAGRERDFAHVSLEWLDPDAGPMLKLTTWRGGERTHTVLASVHHHGRRIEWLDRATSA